MDPTAKIFKNKLPGKSRIGSSKCEEDVGEEKTKLERLNTSG